MNNSQKIIIIIAIIVVIWLIFNKNQCNEGLKDVSGTIPVTDKVLTEDIKKQLKDEIKNTINKEEVKNIIKQEIVSELKQEIEKDMYIDAPILKEKRVTFKDEIEVKKIDEIIVKNEVKNINGIQLMQIEPTKSTKSKKSLFDYILILISIILIVSVVLSIYKKKAPEITTPFSTVSSSM
jgi:hypothetical protein